MLYYGNKVLKILQHCSRKRHIPGTECFRANIKNGFVLVECREVDVFMESFLYDENGAETRALWAGSFTDAATRLESFEVDLSSIETLKRTLGSCVLLKKTEHIPIQYDVVCEGFGKPDANSEPCGFCQNCSFYDRYN